MRCSCQSLLVRSFEYETYAFKKVTREATVSNVELCHVASISDRCSEIKYQSLFDCQRCCIAITNQLHRLFVLLIRTDWNLFLAFSTLRGLRRCMSRSSASYHLEFKPGYLPTRLPTSKMKAQLSPKLKASLLPLILSFFHVSRPRLRILFTFCRRLSC